MDPVQLMMAAHQADAAVAAQTPDQALQAAIAQSRPDLWVALSTNPAVYPDLLDWLARTGNAEILANLRARGHLTDDAAAGTAGSAETAGTAGSGEPVAAAGAPAQGAPTEAEQADAAVAAQTPDQALQAAIAQSRPDLWVALSTNPAVYPDLLDWLARTGNAEVLANLRARGHLTDDAAAGTAGSAEDAADAADAESGEPAVEPAVAREMSAEDELVEAAPVDADEADTTDETDESGADEPEPDEGDEAVDEPVIDADSQEDQESSEEPTEEPAAEARSSGEPADETDDEPEGPAAEENADAADDLSAEDGSAEDDSAEDGSVEDDEREAEEPSEEAADQDSDDRDSEEPVAEDSAADDSAEEETDETAEGAGEAEPAAAADEVESSADESDEAGVESEEDEQEPSDEEPAADVPQDADQDSEESVAEDSAADDSAEEPDEPEDAEDNTEDIAEDASEDASEDIAEDAAVAAPSEEDLEEEPEAAAEDQVADDEAAPADGEAESSSSAEEAGSQTEAFPATEATAVFAASQLPAADSAESVAMPMPPPPSAEDIAAWAETPSGAPSGFSAPQPAVELDMFGPQMPPPQQKQTTGSSNGRLVAVIVVLLLVIVGGGGVWAGSYFSGRNDDSSGSSQDKADGQGGKQDSGQADAAATATASALPSGAIKACSSMPDLTITSVEDGQGELKVQANVTTSCADGDFLAGPSNQVLIYSSTSPTGGADTDHLVASGTFDLSSDPLIIPNGGRTLTLRFGEQHYFRIAKDLDLKGLKITPTFDRGSQSSVTSSSSANSPMTIASSSISSANQEQQDEQAAGQALRWQADHDRPVVMSKFLGKWTPQLSSKQVNLFADGQTWTNRLILAEFLKTRQADPNAVLVNSSDWSVFDVGGWWVTLSGELYGSADEANAWCDAQGYDAEHCLAKRMESSGPPQGTTKSR
ncbi:hypothetical protein [Actinomyces viscosus]|uniref:Leucine rich repeat variant domain-containing protein n=1 Tax=Actinomyces viscosus TaxID=1656 RepID=A0A448PLR6_ACTVI|nr:hypothetical protein [Actinomyces viscosus]VEI16587.1 Uncharacterised protein [Actinomyces viscosus]